RRCRLLQVSKHFRILGGRLVPIGVQLLRPVPGRPIPTPSHPYLANTSRRATMTKRLPSLLLLGCAALLLSASVAEAQVVRPNKTLYISARVGLATYGGDADNNPDNSVSTYLEDGSIGGALELGYQFTPSLGFGVAFNYGDYSRLETDA